MRKTRQTRGGTGEGASIYTRHGRDLTNMQSQGQPSTPPLSCPLLDSYWRDSWLTRVRRPCFFAQLGNGRRHLTRKSNWMGFRCVRLNVSRGFPPPDLGKTSTISFPLAVRIARNGGMDKVDGWDGSVQTGRGAYLPRHLRDSVRRTAKWWHTRCHLRSTG